MNHQAIYNTHPNVVRIDDTAGCFDADGNPVAITQSLVDEEVARLQAEYDSKAYARARAEAYAPIADQLDMQYWDSVNGSRTWLDHIEAVKEAHPK
tara:strand:- start:43 stop:330 length:288 start_codon:yes stop_codon:yes gene_type:complete